MSLEPDNLVVPEGDPVDGKQLMRTVTGASFSAATEPNKVLATNPTGLDLVLRSFLTQEMQFSRRNNTTAGSFLRVGQVNEGTHVPIFQSEIYRVAISRVDTDAATLEIVVNDVVAGEFPTAARTQVLPAGIPVEIGDRVQVRNKAGSNAVRDCICHLTLRLR